MRLENYIPALISWKIEKVNRIILAVNLFINNLKKPS